MPPALRTFLSLCLVMVWVVVVVVVLMVAVLMVAVLMVVVVTPCGVKWLLLFYQSVKVKF